MAEENLSSVSNPGKPELDYAWNWFQYHASQRLTAFNFFLVLIGFLLVTFAQAVHYDWVAVGCAIGLLGALVSFGFWALDVRNEELIQCGWSALSELEGDARLGIVAACDERTHLVSALGRSPLGTGLFGKGMNGESKRTRIFKHRTWLRLIMAAVGIAFSVAAIWAVAGFPGASRASTGRDGYRLLPQESKEDLRALPQPSPETPGSEG